MVLLESKLAVVGYPDAPLFNKQTQASSNKIAPSRPCNTYSSSPPTAKKPPRAIIFDLGDVLFQWSAKTTTTIPARKLRDILSTPIWHSYERGEISRDECFEQSAQKFSLQAHEIAEAFTQARASVQPDHDIVAFLKELKADPAVEVYAMSNIGQEDYEDVLEGRPAGDPMWLPGLFDNVFSSAGAGHRKPERAFYQQVLDQIGHVGQDVMFIDDKEENIRAARGFGIHGVVFKNGQATVDMLKAILYSPVGQGWRYLYQNANTCNSKTETGVAFADTFAKLLTADTLQDQTLINLSWGTGETWNFFADGDVPALVPGGVFPDDLDTTSLALQVLPPSRDGLVTSVLDKMASCANADGTFMTYFDPERIRIDPIVSANILGCFYSFSRGHLFPKTLDMVHEFIRGRSYLPNGTKYYPSPDVCLFFLSRLLDAPPENDSTGLRQRLAPLLATQVRERIQASLMGGDQSRGTALDIACRILSSAQVGIPPREYEHERRALLELQAGDGSWETGWIYQYGSTGIKIGNTAVTTAIAVKALQVMSETD
ncbi:alpha-D-glucose-1-phosphate phosphatase YihX [Rhypophila decipiens]